MVLASSHSFISDRENMPAILFHFLCIPIKLVTRFSLKQSCFKCLDLLHCYAPFIPTGNAARSQLASLSRSEQKPSVCVFLFSNMYSNMVYWASGVMNSIDASLSI